MSPDLVWAVTEDGTLDPLLNTAKDPWAYIAVVAIGLIVFVVRALITGDLRSGREASALEKRAENAEGAMRVRDEQIDGALRILPQIAEVLEKFHTAGEQIRQESETEGDSP